MKMPTKVSRHPRPGPPSAKPRTTTAASGRRSSPLNGDRAPLAFAPAEDSLSASLHSLLDALPMPLVLLSAQRARLGANHAAHGSLARCLTVCATAASAGFAVPASDAFEPLFRQAVDGREAGAVVRPQGCAGICPRRRCH